jgi:hypothetical protein
MTKFLMAVYGPAEYDGEFYGYGSEEEMRESMAETSAFNESLKEKGYWVFADGLEEAATAKVVDGQGGAPVVTDGPYPEAKEFMGGFWIIDVPDLEVALELAAEASKACRGKVEVRPFQTAPPS